MAATVAASLVLMAAAGVVGTAVCRLGGLSDARGVAPAVGLASLMAIAAPAAHLGGGAGWARAAVVAAIVAALAGLAARRSGSAGLRDAVVVTLGGLALLCLPWLAAGHFGVLGMGVNNDTAAHLVAAQWLIDHRMPVADTLVGDGYPLGPHALAAVLSTPGVPLEAAFSAVAIAGPSVAAVAALDGLPASGRPLRCALALLVGLSYLTAAYFAQMAFKETIEAGLTLAFALTLPAAARAAGRGSRAAAQSALPLAVLVAGMVQTMSWPGAVWPVAMLVVWAALGWTGLRRMRRAASAALFSGAIATALLISLEIPRLLTFQGSHYAHEPAGGLGNLARPLPPHEALGVWLNRDFRFSPHLPVLNAGLTVAAATLATVGVIGWLRRGERALPAAMIAGWLVWALLAVTKNGYNASKGLVVIAPLVTLAVVNGAAAVWRRLGGGAPAPATPRADGGVLRFAMLLPLPPATGRRTALAAATAAVLCAAAVSSAWALRDGAVGAGAHPRELRALAAAAPKGPMLVLDSSDFIAWDLYGIDVWRPPLVYQVHTVPTRQGKPHSGGQPFDLDSVSSDTLNGFASVLTDRNAAGSVAPPGLRVLRRTASFVLWERVATVPQRETLGEGWEPGKILDCSKPSHEAIARRAGWAIVRPRPVIATAAGWHGDARVAGSSASRTLRLPPGRWDLSLQYVSRNPIDVSAGGRTTTLPANLDRLGPLFAAGTTPGGRQAVRVGVHRLSGLGPLLGATTPTRAFDSYRHQPLGALVATRHVAPTRVPLADACGRYVDSYVVR